LHRLAREVKAHITTLQAYQQPAYREDVTACLGELCYALGTSGGYPAVYFEPMGDSELAEELMVLGGELRTRLPRKFAAILRAQRFDRRRCVIWWELPEEEVDPLSLDDSRRCA
jgi:hypothetical protein